MIKIFVTYCCKLQNSSHSTRIEPMAKCAQGQYAKTLEVIVAFRICGNLTVTLKVQRTGNVP